MKDPLKLTSEIKASLGNLTDQEIAEYFNYKNRLSYATSSKKPWIENGLIRFLDRVKQNFALVPKKEAEFLVGILEDLEDLERDDLTEEEVAILSTIKEKLKAVNN